MIGVLVVAAMFIVIPLALVALLPLFEDPVSKTAWDLEIEQALAASGDDEAAAAVFRRQLDAFGTGDAA